MLKELPVGISTLSEIVNNNCVYVDKTKFIAQLVKNKYYFLSRPRRFGKSLFMDTIKQAFLGKKELFKGLYLESNWDFNNTHPVIHISFASEVHDVKLLEQNIHEILNRIIISYGLNEILAEKLVNNKLVLLIEKLFVKFKQQRVVILVDEYDKPILDNIDDIEAAGYARSLLKSLYSGIKDCDSYLRFVLLTGVTKFAKAGVFSNLNNLEDITLNKAYADVCGYTQNDIENIFKDYLKDVDADKLKIWYNGYSFLGTEAQNVYNPYDILLFIRNDKKYRNYWFGTGTPNFLIKLLQKNRYYIPRAEGIKLTESALDSFDIENLSIEVLLLQSGYLTIVDTKTSQNGVTYYILDYPNFEVKQSLNDRILSSLFGGDKDGALNDRISEMEEALAENKLDQIENKLKNLFASIPYDWYRNNNIQDYEGYYCSIVYTLFNTMGFKVIPEDKTSLEQIDLSIHMDDKILILEFKMLKNGNAVTALQQIKDKKYYEKYLAQNKPIYLIAIVFDAEARNLCKYVWERFR